MIRLVLRAYAELIRFDRHVSRSDFATLREMVRKSRTQAGKHSAISCAQLCRAVDLACIWYWKQVLCLHRSAALTCLLRQYGTKAQMVIASRRLPFRAHAWVEVDGRVVNDRPDVQQTYAVLDRC